MQPSRDIAEVEMRLLIPAKEDFEWLTKELKKGNENT
jgi:hypothetical protein